jgi:hypothetical protein
LSNPNAAVRLSHDGPASRPAAEEKLMTQYLVAIHHPDDFEPFSESEATRADIAALNLEMQARSAIVFVGGLKPVKTAKSVRLRSGGKLSMTDGPYIESKEHIGGFWVLECATEEEALEWGQKAALACRAPVEVRPFFGRQPGDPA